MIIILIFVIFLIILMFIKVEIKFIFNYSESNIKFDVYLYKFDITKFMEKDKKKLNHNNEVLKNETNKKRLDFQISLNLLLEILSKIKFLKRKPRFIIENYLEFGLDEADITAILYGHLTSFIYFILGRISTYVDLKETKINVIPRYNSNFLKFYFQGILQIRIAQIIYISFLFITLGRKLNGSTSN